MASTDGRPIPLKNVAYRVTFPILDATGSLVTGATSPDSEISKDGGTFADCTNEATEIATASGMYYLDLTSTEMNADTVAIIVKSGNGKTTPIVLYPQENDDIRVAVTHWVATAVASNVAGVPIVDLLYIYGDLATGIKLAEWLAALVSGIADSGTTTTMVDAARTEAATDYWKGSQIVFTSGTIAWQTRLITGFTPASDTITFSPATTAAVGTNSYVIIPAGRADIALLLGTAFATPAVPGIPTVQLSAAGVDEILDEVVEGTTTVRQSLRLANSANGGKAAGMGTTTATVRDLADTKDRITATVDADGNRSAVTRDLT